MDRFFSKLDLRDIKIDPGSTSFPPDADDDVDQDQVEATADEPDEPRLADVDRVEPESPQLPPHAPTWESAHRAAEAVNGYHDATDEDGIPARDSRHPVAVEERDAYVANSELQHQGEVLKVSARSRPSAVAGAIAGVVREAGRAEVQAIGAGATNQAVKAVAIARDYLRETGIEAVCLPAFIDVTIENEDRTAIRLVVEPR
jgi:stage V sporulation protein S